MIVLLYIPARPLPPNTYTHKKPILPVNAERNSPAALEEESCHVVNCPWRRPVGGNCGWLLGPSGGLQPTASNRASPSVLQPSTKFLPAPWASLKADPFHLMRNTALQMRTQSGQYLDCSLVRLWVQDLATSQADSWLKLWDSKYMLF